MSSNMVSLCGSPLQVRELRIPKNYGGAYTVDLTDAKSGPNAVIAHGIMVNSNQDVTVSQITGKNEVVLSSDNGGPTFVSAQPGALQQSLKQLNLLA